MNINQYRVIREISQNFADKIVKSIPKQIHLYAAKELGFWFNNRILLASEFEGDLLMDFIIYEKTLNNKKHIDTYYDSDVELSDEDEYLLRNAVKSFNSLFEIKAIDRDNYILTLVDLLDADKNEYQLIDMAFATTVQEKSLIYTRLIPINSNLNMTSGVSFPFNPQRLDAILVSLSNAKYKKNNRFNSTDLHLFFYKKYKEIGDKIMTLDIV